MTPDPSGPYWEGAAAGRLVLQRCDRCGTIRHYPRVMCSECYSFEHSPVDGGDEGTIHSWTVAHHRFGPDLPAEVPYTLVTVDLPSGVRMLGLLRSGLPSPGLPVRLAFEAAGAEGRPIPIFTATT